MVGRWKGERDRVDEREVDDNISGYLRSDREEEERVRVGGEKAFGPSRRREERGKGGETYSPPMGSVSSSFNGESKTMPIAELDGPVEKHRKKRETMSSRIGKGRG